MLRRGLILLAVPAMLGGCAAVGQAVQATSDTVRSATSALGDTMTRTGQSLQNTGNNLSSDSSYRGYGGGGTYTGPNRSSGGMGISAEEGIARQSGGSPSRSQVVQPFQKSVVDSQTGEPVGGGGGVVKRDSGGGSLLRWLSFL